MIRRPPRSTQSRSSAASDVYKRQMYDPSIPQQPAPPGSIPAPGPYPDQHANYVVPPPSYIPQNQPYQQQTYPPQGYPVQQYPPQPYPQQNYNPEPQVEKKPKKDNSGEQCCLIACCACLCASLCAVCCLGGGGGHGHRGHRGPPPRYGPPRHGPPRGPPPRRRF
eukprot:TRINITY_DN600_c0_g1_i2.p1 TRINITY_DN600_c0_g1~~TRINITY_DN600_c0_g1_i2.p1  ORF type:complete len:173 (-),score=33.38 TRINITY_DN600_c0_g1_i2:102-596(-)